MFMRRSPFGLFLVLGAGLLLGAALFGGPETAGGLLAAPFIVVGLVFKIALFALLFGFIAKKVGGHWHDPEGRRSRMQGGSRSTPPWWAEHARHHRRGTSEAEEPSGGSNQFDEWHRMAHARQEVDDHVPPVEE